jgi:hypothetical protein
MRPSTTLLWSVPYISHLCKLSPIQALWGRWCFFGQLVYLQFCEGVPLSHSLDLKAPWPLCYIFFSLFQLLVYYSDFFSFFSLDGGQSVQGAMLIWPRIVCGSTTCHLAHLVVCFSQASYVLASGSTTALLVSLFNVQWGCYAWAGDVECWSFPLLCVFSYMVYLQCLYKILL